MLVTVTPSYQLGNSDRLTPARLNRLARPTFSISGTVATSEINDGAIKSNHTEPGAFFYGAGTFSGGTYSVDLTPNMPTGYVTGAHVYFIANAVNTGATDINCDSRGVKDLVKAVDTSSSPVFVELVAGDIRAGQPVHCIYDGTRFVVLSPLGHKVLDSGTASGTDTYAFAAHPAYTSYDQLTSRPLLLTFTNANTTSATLNVNGLGAKNIYKNKSTALTAGDIRAGQIIILTYDGTNFQVSGAASPLSQEATVDDDAGALSGTGSGTRTLTCSFQPKTWRIVARCTTAPDAGYASGDEVDLTGFIFHPGTGSTDTEDNYTGSSVAAVYRDGNAIKVKIHDTGDQTGRWEVPNKSTGSFTAISRSSWTLRAYIYG